MAPFLVPFHSFCHLNRFGYFHFHFLWILCLARRLAREALCFAAGRVAVLVTIGSDNDVICHITMMMVSLDLGGWCLCGREFNLHNFEYDSVFVVKTALKLELRVKIRKGQGKKTQTSSPPRVNQQQTKATNFISHFLMKFIGARACACNWLSIANAFVFETCVFFHRSDTDGAPHSHRDQQTRWIHVFNMHP